MAQPELVAVVVQRVDEAEMDEMWSFVGNQKQERWLWHAIEHASGKVLAYVLSDPSDAALKSLQQLLMPFGI